MGVASLGGDRPASPDFAMLARVFGGSGLAPHI